MPPVFNVCLNLAAQRVDDKVLTQGAELFYNDLLVLKKKPLSLTLTMQTTWIY